MVHRPSEPVVYRTSEPGHVTNAVSSSSYLDDFRRGRSHAMLPSADMPSSPKRSLHLWNIANQTEEEPGMSAMFWGVMRTRDVCIKRPRTRVPVPPDIRERMGERVCRVPGLPILRVKKAHEAEVVGTGNKLFDMGWE